jgi:hypothetical protein
MNDETEIPAEEELQETETAELETEEEVEAEAEQTPEEIEAEAAKRRKSEKTQKRINDLTRKRREAETEAARLREELARYKKPVEPDPDNFESQDEYIAAKVAFEVNKNKPQEATTQNIDITPTLNSGREKYQDFDAVALNPNLPITKEMAELIAEAENGDDIFYHLGKNPVELERISLLDSRDMARELGRLETRLSIPKPRTTKAPKPVTPLDESGKQEPDYSNETMAQYAARMNKKQYG